MRYMMYYNHLYLNSRSSKNKTLLCLVSEKIGVHKKICQNTWILYELTLSRTVELQKGFHEQIFSQLRNSALNVSAGPCGSSCSIRQKNLRVIRFYVWNFEDASCNVDHHLQYTVVIPFCRLLWNLRNVLLCKRNKHRKKKLKILNSIF